MMVRMINILGNEMWVAEDRVEEYLAAGHRLAASKSEAPEPAKAPRKTSAVKPRTKKR